jgi:tRNA modification GTPase
MTSDHDPIIAIATAPGRAGIGIVRISGTSVTTLMSAVCGRSLEPRHATHLAFLDESGAAIDAGIAVYFPGPHSYTGEDVLELQGHGGPMVQQMLLSRCLDVAASQGLRIAEPGEFTRRALMNDKLDLAQAEAVADLIEAGTAAAVRAAQQSLSGAFSLRVNELVEALTSFRMLVEATLDFPEEEIDFLERADGRGKLSRIINQLNELLERASQGAILREGLKVVLAGRPNVGKSSLLNALAQVEVAIVTPIAGTTRDKVSQTIQIEGIALHVVDTAGLRATEDEIERIGISRTWAEIESADVILHLQDARRPDSPEDAEIAARLPAGIPRRIIENKIDLIAASARVEGERIFVSALSGAGIDLIREQLLTIAGWHSIHEGVFLARERHLVALRSALQHLNAAQTYALRADEALDLLAEELRLAQHDLGLITGAVTADDLLGEIFSRFCIGK